MGTENSSNDTRQRAKDLGNAIGSYHIDLNMDSVVTAVRTLFGYVTGVTPKFKVHGGSEAENLALQNIQVRTHKFVTSTNYLVKLVLTGSYPNGPLLSICSVDAFCSRPRGKSAGPRKC